MRRLVLVVLVLVAESVRSAPVEYTVELLPDEHALAVAVCVSAPAERRVFRAAHARAGEFLRAPRRRGGGALARSAGALVAEGWSAGECLDYRVDTRRLAGAGDAGWGRAGAGDFDTSPRAWLWRPTERARASDAEIRFVLPPGWSVSAPWEPLDVAPPHARFRVGATTPSWPALVAFGRFEQRDIATPAGALRFALLGSAGTAQTENLARFVALTSADVAATFPRAFARSPQIALIPVAAHDDPVPFGQSLRGGGTAIVLFVDATRPLEDYLGNWTLTHELTHLVHPYLGDDGRWISEGIATYYQNVLRARTGRISATQAWQKLEAGFARGRANVSSLSLRETSAQMDQGRLYMRGYWSGTALMLMADLKLRMRPREPSSLDAVLNRFIDCCRDAVPFREPREFLAELDRLAGEAVFVPLYDAHAEQAAFPELAAVYRALGIEARGRTLRFSDAPAAARLRAAIMGGE